MRPSIDEYFMAMAVLAATRSTCRRRSVGCVLVDRDRRVLSTGYNGVPSGFRHCLEEPCSAADAPSGTALDECMAIHAEQNALMMCPDPSRIVAAYCTTRPCPSCLKLLVNTPCERIVYSQDYPGTTELWRGREMVHVPLERIQGLIDELRGDRR